MRSEREDDTSKPLLDAMRKAATQFSGKRPSFIAVQFQEIEAADLMLPHLRRRLGILSYALFGHYGALHVNATYFCGFGAVIHGDGEIGTPAFAIPNPRPTFAVNHLYLLFCTRRAETRNRGHSGPNSGPAATGSQTR